MSVVQAPEKRYSDGACVARILSNDLTSHDLLTHGDHYLVLADFASYVACQGEVEAAYRDQQQWLRRVILNVANMGISSSDRTVLEYAQQIRQAKPVSR